MDILLDQAIQTVVVPAGVAGGIYYFRYLFTERWQKLLVSAASPLGFMASFLLIMGMPKTWPLPALSYLVVLAIVAFLFSFIIEKIDLSWIKLDAVVTFSLAALLCHAGLSIYSLLSGSASLAQLMGAFCSTLGPFLILAMLRKRERKEMRIFSYLDFMALGFLYVFYTFIEFESLDFLWCYLPYLIAAIFLFVGRRVPTTIKVIIILLVSLPVIGYILNNLYQSAGPMY